MEESQSCLPIWTMVGFLGIFLGMVLLLYGQAFSLYCFLLGLLSFGATLVPWYASAFSENAARYISFRVSMVWYIFLMLFLFMVVFTVISYIRTWVLPLLLGAVKTKVLAHEVFFPMLQDKLPSLPLPKLDKVVMPNVILTVDSIPFMNTVLLMVSSMMANISYYAFSKGRLSVARSCLVVVTVLAGLFVLRQGWSIWGFFQRTAWDTSLYGLVYYSVVGVHALFVLFAMVASWVVVWKCRIISEVSHFVQGTVVWYWHFIDMVWLTLFMLIYWV